MSPRFHLPSAVAGAASASAALILLFGRPKDPTFHLISITLSSFSLNLPLLDLDLIRPKPSPRRSAPRSCQPHQAPRRGSTGIQMAHHAGSILADVARREMRLDAEVEIAGTARVLFMRRRFCAKVESHVVVDPVFLDVVEQENTTETHLLA
ncbi:uncharacterized protein LOC109838316 [Asparagus officinalis]|uniref:uncharacterized protein LOC109838316 n=1 Tax=Asparagus officinalis TaxID=4686 RepID=UPI00098E1C80|nr:uncharacterized protein LOC109838316 [Asparagus officinalis]